MVRISQQRFRKRPATRIFAGRERERGGWGRRSHVREVRRLMRGCGIGAMVMVHMMSLWLVPDQLVEEGLYLVLLSYMRWEKHNIEHDRSVTGQEEKEHLKPPTTNFGLCNNKKEPIPKYTIGFGGVLWDSPKILGVESGWGATQFWSVSGLCEGSGRGSKFQFGREEYCVLICGGQSKRYLCIGSMNRRPSLFAQF